MSTDAGQPIRGTSTAMTPIHEARSSTKEAAFLLPYMRPGMRVLDCGSGPGTITLGLARAVGSGEVVGVDLDEKRVEGARARAAEAGLTNVKFEVASAYDLPFADETFDAVFENAVLIHLDDPLSAVREMLRVLKPGGVAGCRDGDWDGRLWVNMSPAMDEVRDFIDERRRIEGTNHYLGKELRGLLRRVGFENVVASASVDCYGTTEEMAFAADVMARGVEAPGTLELALAHGLADEQTLARYATTLREWGADADTFHVQLFCEAVGWKRDGD